jgi:hypothetical protein
MSLPVGSLEGSLMIYLIRIGCSCSEGMHSSSLTMVARWMANPDPCPIIGIRVTLSLNSLVYMNGDSAPKEMVGNGFATLIA